MNRSLLGLTLLLVALAGAVWAGTAVRHALEKPGPVDVVRAATRAYAAGDCAALRAVAVHPGSIGCASVRAVQKAYRDEGLQPAAFTYALMSRDDDNATVRISYVSGGAPRDELIPVQRHDGDWRVPASAQHVD